MNDDPPDRHRGRDLDPYISEENQQIGAEHVARYVPSHYLDAKPDDPQVQEWMSTLLTVACQRRRPAVRRGPSLMLLGGTGTGKTYQAYGAVIALSNSGVACRWQFTTAADLYARLRPRPRVDSEEEFGRTARSALLVLDDLGAAKATDWTEEVNYRLINYRYEHELPTLVTSNVAPKKLAAVLGERVVSRLLEMAERVVLDGDDRRRKSTAITQNQE